MKTNLPITTREVMMDEGATIVTKTDLRGSITYANPDFINISGFAESELLGQNHTSCATRTCRWRPLPTCGRR